MTPEEDLKRLNRLIRQYETVFRTTPDLDQRDRVERQLKELQSYREKILAVNVIDGRDLDETPEETEEFAEYPILAGLLKENAALPPSRGVPHFSAKDAAPTSTQMEMFHVALYARYFEQEFLPFLTAKQLKLDFSLSMDRDGFYTSYQALQRKLGEYREENRRLAEGMPSRDMETETRRRAFTLTRLIGVEAAHFFREIERFCDELGEDARGNGVKCLNCDAEIAFDIIEGSRRLQGMKVSEALAELEDFASEVVAFLNIPEIETQEKDRADRH